MPRETKYKGKICDVTYVYDGELIEIHAKPRDLRHGEYETRFSKVERLLLENGWKKAIVHFPDVGMTISAKAAIVGWFAGRNIVLQRRIERGALVLEK